VTNIFRLDRHPYLVLWYTWICKHGVGLQKKTPVTPNVGGSIIVVDVMLVDHNAEADEAADNKAAEDAGKKRTRKREKKCG